MEFAMIGFSPPPPPGTELVRPFISLISLYIYIYIYSYICAPVADTRNETIPDKQGSQRCDFPLPMSFRNWFTFGSSPLRQRRDRERFFFGNTPVIQRIAHLQMATNFYVASKEISVFICLPLPFWGCTNQLEIDPSNFGIFHRWNITFYVCLLQVKERRFIHLIDRRNMGSHKGHFHKFGY